MNMFNLKDRPSVIVSCNWDSNVVNKSIEDTILVNFVKDEEITFEEDMK